MNLSRNTIDRLLPPMCRLLSVPAAAAAALLALSGGAAAQGTPEPTLPSAIEHLLEREPLAPVTVDPMHQYALLVQRHELLSMDQLSEPTIELAGHKINPLTGSAHAPLAYYGLTLIDLVTREETPLELPPGAVVGYPHWAPDGSRFAFTLTRADDTELWVGDSADGRVRLVASSIDTARGRPCEWLADSRRLVCRHVNVRENRAAIGPAFERLAAQALPTEPLTLGEDLARRLLETQLEIVDAVSGQREAIGRPTAFESVEPAPDGTFLLITRIAKPYPRITGVDGAERVTEVWDRFGNVVRRLPGGLRAVAWQSSEPSTLTWVESRRGVDRIMRMPMQSGGSAQEGFVLPHRFGGLCWLAEGSAALVSDYDSSSRVTELWYIDFARPTWPARLVVAYPAESGRLPVMTTNGEGFPTLVEHDGGFFLRGQKTDENGPHSVLEHVSFQTGSRRVVWEGDARDEEGLVDVLRPDASVLLVRRQTAVGTPNYVVSTWRGRDVWHVTKLEHDAPLAGAGYVHLDYKRDDGVDLAASLYLPPGYDSSTRLPLIIWAYPRQISPGGATRTEVPKAESMSFERAFRLFYLLRGYAVLDDVSMPIVGTEAAANDTFVQQVVMNAAAAVNTAVATGHIDPSRVGVAGHSYGAFMVANLLAHSRLFAAGAALSGAYNRTLTPFGFQTERRTLWQAQKTYLAMSPLLYSDNIKAPLLLVHGLKDDNLGTSPLQSVQFYQAIRGNGGDVELLLLPWEGHSYRGRESVLKTAAYMLRWFDEHLKDPPARDTTPRP